MATAAEKRRRGLHEAADRTVSSSANLREFLSTGWADFHTQFRTQATRNRVEILDGGGIGRLVDQKW